MVATVNEIRRSKVQSRRFVEEKEAEHGENFRGLWEALSSSVFFW